MPMSNLSLQQIEAFHANGYIIIKGFCSIPETNKLLAEAQKVGVIAESELDNDAQPGKTIQRPWWDAPDDGVLTYLTHSEKVVTAVSQVLDSNSPVCHIDAKFIEKQPNVGGSWAWHQDYAWWYANQLLFPDQVASIAVALTQTSKATGCSQLIKGSHKMGRLDHGFGEGNKPLGADMNMVNYALSTLEIVHLEMAPGDAVLFHSNLLHRCETNSSDQPSWFIVSTYASQQNLSTNNTLAAFHQPIEVVPNEAILERQDQYLSEEELIKTQGNLFLIDQVINQVLRAS
jgi:ectoine hydroxylase-related dioxygenase (phytanoyl-CoA dioxygenase family)